MLVAVVFDWKRLYIFIQGSVDMQGFFKFTGNMAKNES